MSLKPLVHAREIGLKYGHALYEHRNRDLAFHKQPKIRHRNHQSSNRPVHIDATSTPFSTLVRKRIYTLPARYIPKPQQ